MVTGVVLFEKCEPASSSQRSLSLKTRPPNELHNSPQESLFDINVSFIYLEDVFVQSNLQMRYNNEAQVTVKSYTFGVVPQFLFCV